MEQKVIAQLLEIKDKGNLDFLNDSDINGAIKDNISEIRKLEVELLKMETKKNKLIDLLTDEIITREEFNIKKAEVVRNILAAKNELPLLKNQANYIEHKVSKLEYFQ